MQDAAAWIILCIVIAFAALVGFFMGRGAARAEDRDTAGEDVSWWPDKWQRLFWLASPFIITIGIAVYGSNHGMETGPLWGFFCALVIIQSVVGGMFGFHFDLVSSITCGIFIAVEILVLGGILLFAVFENPKFFAWYLVLGILAVSAGAVLAAWHGSTLTHRRGRGK